LDWAFYHEFGGKERWAAALAEPEELVEILLLQQSTFAGWADRRCGVRRPDAGTVAGVEEEAEEAAESRSGAAVKRTKGQSGPSLFPLRHESIVEIST
jgi:hypothetical protein